MRTSSQLRPKRTIAAVAAAVALTLGVTACGGTTDPGTDPTDGAVSNATLTLAIQAPPPSLDPAQLDEGTGTFIWSSVFDTLLKVDNEGKIVANAAEAWEYSEDLLTLTLTLREGLTFSDGDAVTAQDVADTLNRTRETPGQQQPKLSSVESVEAPDDRTVVLTLSQPDPVLVNYLAQATGVIGDPEVLDDPESALRPVGSGPYELSDATVDGTSYVLERRDDYWNAEAYPFAKVTVRVIQDGTAIFNALIAGELNAANIQAPQLEQAEASNLQVAQISSAATILLLMADREGTIQPALADERVRQAINMAFDRQLYVDKLFAGIAQPTEQNFNMNGAAYDASLEGTYPYDPDKARELLAEAGYADGFTLTMPSTLISQNYEPAITDSLGDIGIKVTWEPVPPQNIASSLTGGTYAAVVWGEGTNLAGREMANHFSPNGFLNPFHWQTDEFDAMLEAIALERDPDAQAELYKKASGYTVEHALNAPIASIGALWATSKDVDVVTKVNVPKTVRMFAPAGD